ncbi:metalloprotease family protein [Halodesulfurarchaeum sp. HSR-GB]|uniref:metalloprotease family protein n=1 Tax=Halodesulfurarchaeum sp. HSR-GB TaxID=3074077 RepID=UPI0028553FA4|nr:metalloprotease family protein [Halodesulfurarchaeum sp. HSR-GB]MDR5657696.1 metalloprotease family protein [Halodesulfurarchaeum sp. HSR-GB]
MTTPESPDGYTPYKKYSPHRLVLLLIIAILLTVAGLVIFLEDVVLYPQNNVKLIVGAGIAIVATIYVHESLHYLANSAIGYDPVFVWPNAVYVPEVSLDLWEITVVLLAPQFLSVTYTVLLITGAVNDLAIVVGWGLILNLGGAASDVFWIVRRLTWPAETKVVVGDDKKNYVAFPKDSL